MPIARSNVFNSTRICSYNLAKTNIYHLFEFRFDHSNAAGAKLYLGDD